jgi:Fe-S-cluster containining protein
MLRAQFEEVGIPLNFDGSCSKLSGNECTIYDERPSFCRVAKNEPPGMTTQEYHKQFANFCNFFQEEDGMPRKFRVHIK